MCRLPESMFDDFPRWGTPEARTAVVVRCWVGHIADRETFEDVRGCPYCLYTPGERAAALQAKEATIRRLTKGRQ